ncbi:phytoene desaturase family protein [Amycolatopsis sp. NPDC051071]|uniref:phytoene desaturase family protein n=1 Tax=Amycolatopsis sp. NPDC051071 TaxID=3154637 RepID=UPI003417C230
MAVRHMAGATDRVVVVGAGLAGLSAALHLVGAGREVVVCEAEESVGGKAGVLRDSGYQFDTGPSVLTMPELIGRAFAAVGERVEDWLAIDRIDPAYRVHYQDGSFVDVMGDPVAMAEEIERVCGSSEAGAYHRYRAFLERMYRYEFRDFIDRNLDGVTSLFTVSLARLVALGGLRSLEGKVGSFFKDQRMRQLFSFQSLYAGVSPRQARALYAVIAYMDVVAGVYFPRGGMHALPEAMAAAAVKHGVRVELGEKVVRLETSASGRCRAVVTQDGTRMPADAVVVTMDPSLALPTLLGRASRPVRLSPSCFLLLTGGRIQAEVHHNIHITRTWAEGFRDIIDRGTLMNDPSFLVSVPSLTDPALAPPGRHCVSVLVPTPNLATGRLDWERISGRYHDHVLDVLRRNGYGELYESRETEHVLAPHHWAQRGCPQGTPFSAAHLLRQTGPFRTRNLVGDNIVLAGAGTHPGVGIPMALISGRLAAERITGSDVGVDA